MFIVRSVITFVLIAWHCSVLAVELESTPPNIVIILADDLGYGDLGCYGHPTIRTTRIDRMAAEGLRFTQFYSASPVCSPSRAALLTGRLPIRTGVNDVFFPDSTGGLPASETTLAEALREKGYATACIGKWHLGHRPQFLPTKNGFDYFFGVPYSNDMSPSTGGKATDPPLPLMRNEQTICADPPQAELTEQYTIEAAKWIKQTISNDPTRPFFLYLAHTMPHVPLAASKRFVGRSAADSTAMLSKRLTGASEKSSMCWRGATSRNVRSSSSRAIMGLGWSWAKLAGLRGCYGTASFQRTRAACVYRAFAGGLDASGRMSLRRLRVHSTCCLRPWRWPVACFLLNGPTTATTCLMFCSTGRIAREAKCSTTPVAPCEQCAWVHGKRTLQSLRH